MTPKHQQTIVRDLLELSENPTREEIDRNYRRLIKQYHPDINRDPNAAEATKRIIKAYAIATGKEKPPQQPVQQPTYQPPTIIIRYGSGGSSWRWTTGTSSSSWW